MTYSPPETAEDEYLSNLDLAARYKAPLETIRKWRSTGYGPPAVKLGRHVRYRRSDVLRWEEEHAGK
jgi:predicted DNA-binding transcriptional regulator AlpA